MVGVIGCFVLGGCERGCLAQWLGERGFGGALPGTTGPETPPSKGPVDLGGTDCSDGLLRCVEGEIEASRIAHIPSHCVKKTEGEKRGSPCTCPWEVVGACTTGCVEEGLEIVASVDAGSSQLCRPDAAVARPLLPAEGGNPIICSMEGYRCVDEVVQLCERPGQPAQLVGKCLNGCATHVEVDPGETKNLNGVLSILCRRDHAERW